MTTKTSSNRNVTRVETRIVEGKIGTHGRTEEDGRILEGGALNLPMKSKISKHPKNSHHYRWVC